LKLRSIFQCPRLQRFLANANSITSHSPVYTKSVKETGFCHGRILWIFLDRNRDRHQNLVNFGALSFQKFYCLERFW